MKKYLLFLSFIITCGANAQMYYKLDTSNSGIYTALNGGTDVSGAAYDSSFNVTLPFAFDYFDKPYNNVYITSTGVYFTPNGNDYIYYTADDVMPVNYDITTSPITFDIVGDIGNRIVKIQYKNITEADLDTTYNYLLNVQIWLYESDNRIEMHFGSSSVTDPQYTKFYIGLDDETHSPYYAIGGTAANPTLLDVSNLGVFNGINSFPKDKQVYIFKPSNWSGLSSVELNPYAFYNTGKGFLLSAKNDAIIEIYDLNGRKLIQTDYHTTSGQSAYTLDLSSGLYMVNIKMDDKIYTEKLCLQR